MRKLISAVFAFCLCLEAASQPYIVSHRGFYKKEGSWENTIPSLKNAQELGGIYGVEFDVNMTADDHLVVYHGPKIVNSNLNAQKDKFADIRKVVLPGGHQIPTLDEYLTQAKKVPSLNLFMEIKKHSSPARETQVVEAVLDLVRKKDMLQQVNFISFSKWVCDEFVRLCPEAKVVYVSSDLFSGIIMPSDLKAQGITGLSYEMNILMNRPDIVDEANKAGVSTTLWMVDNSEVIDWAIRHKVTYISTDYPDKAKAYLESVRSFETKR